MKTLCLDESLRQKVISQFGLAYAIYPITNGDYPYDLLLLADETRDAINRYVHIGDVFVLQHEHENQAVFCLLPIDQDTVELKNIAVLQTEQNKGIGSRLLWLIQASLATLGFKNLIVGTPSCAQKQIHFYQKNGFQPHSIRKNFFLENYEQAIIEDGVQLIDMLVLQNILLD